MNCGRSSPALPSSVPRGLARRNTEPPHSGRQPLSRLRQIHWPGTYRLRWDGCDLPGSRHRPRPHDRRQSHPRAPSHEPEKVLRFQEEAQVASQLQHPSIAPVHEVGIIAGNPPRPFFTMRLIEGQTLGEAIEHHRTKPSDQGREHYCATLSRSATRSPTGTSRQILHRDLKPSNVMVGPYGDVQVMDWGLSKNLSGQQPTDLTNAGENRLAPPGPALCENGPVRKPSRGEHGGGSAGDASLHVDGAGQRPGGRAAERCVRPWGDSV